MESHRLGYVGEAVVIGYGINVIHIRYSYGRTRLKIPYHVEDALHQKFAIDETVLVYITAADGCAEILLKKVEVNLDTIPSTL